MAKAVHFVVVSTSALKVVASFDDLKNVAAKVTLPASGTIIPKIPNSHSVKHAELI